MLRFGFFLGAAFQIRDDVLNLTGSTGAYGKEPLGDLREGKQTLMLIHLLAAAGPADRAQVVDYVALEPADRSADVTADILGADAARTAASRSPTSSPGASPARPPLAFEEAFAGGARLPRPPVRARPRRLHGRPRPLNSAAAGHRRGGSGWVHPWPHIGQRGLVIR